MITNQNNKSTYVGNNNTTVFPRLFPVWNANQVKVVLTENNTDTVLTLGTHYTVQGVNNPNPATWTITYPVSGAPLSPSQKLTIVSNIPYVQDTDFANQGGFFAETHEDVADKMVLMIQQLEEQISRAVKVAIGSNTTPEALIAQIQTGAANAVASAAAASTSAANAAASAAAASTSAANAAASAAAASNSETNASNSAAAASTSAANAAASAAAASNSETNASNSAAAASTSAANAAASAAAASNSETNASNSAAAASTSAANASNSAAAAATSAANATSSAIAAQNSQNKAQQWAENPHNVEVDTGLYSAKHWAIVAQNNAGAWGTKTVPVGDVVGTTDVQTLTNKTLTSPIINSPKLRFDPKSANFTAEAFGHYATSGNLTVSDPPSPVTGHYYVVLVQSGTATIGGTGFGPSRVPIYRYYNGTTWVTLGPQGEVVGTTATQTLTNKTIDEPIINSANFIRNSSNLSLWSANIYTPTIYDPHIRFTQQTSSFTAQTYRHYATAGTVTVTDPASPSEGHYYLVLVQSGTATIGGVAFGPSRFPIYRYYNGSSWVTLPASVATDATLNGPNNTAPNQTAASASSLMTRALSDDRYAPKSLQNNSPALDAMLLACRPALRFGTTWQLANGGTWSNWMPTNDNSWAQLRLQVAASTAPSWSRASIYNFNLLTGEASNTYANRGFIFSAWLNAPSDSAAIGLRTTFYFGGTGSETGGALSDRGLRVAFVGNSPNSNYLVEAAIHNGTSETLQSANVASANFRNGIMIRWLPVGGPPTSGSQLQVWGLGADKVLRLLTTATLSSAFSNNNFAGSRFVVVASSVGTTPGYTANWEIGGMTVFID